MKSPWAIPRLPDAVVQASFEVDRSLLRWFLWLTPRERLRAATRAARMFGRFRAAGPHEARERRGG